MKNFIICGLIVFLSIGCNSNKKDWENAKSLNSLIGYKNFLTNHPNDEFTQKAIFMIDSLEWTEAFASYDTIRIRSYIKSHTSSRYLENAKFTLDSLDWVVILKTHNTDSLELFIKDHTSSKFLSTSICAMDSLEWKIAFYSRDTTSLSQYIKKYPNSPNALKAKDIISKQQIQPVKIGKINSVSIYTKDGGHAYGMLMFYTGNSGMAQSSGGMPPEVIIWREFSAGSIANAKKLGVKPGIAYLNEGANKYKFIRKVDLNKTDEQLCAEFGVSSK